MTDDDRAELLKLQARIPAAEQARKDAIQARNEFIRALWTRYGRGIVAEIARTLGDQVKGQTISRIIHRPSSEEGSPGGAWRSR
jgi:DNA-binding GntR family transcriptional regulator